MGNLLDRLVALWKREQPLERLPSPGLDRRAFLKVLGGSAAVAAAVPLLDLEALVWTPDKTILIPALAEHGLISIEWMTKEVLKVMTKNLEHLKWCNRAYDDQFQQDGAKIGTTIPVRTPGRRTIHEATLTQQLSIGARLTHENRMTLDRKAVRERFVEPIARRLTAEVRDSQATVFGVLQRPSASLDPTAIAIDTKTGISVRGMQEYDVERDWEHVRFDVLVGS